MTDFYATAAGAGVKDGSEWAKAFGWVELRAYLLSSLAPDDNFYIEGGNGVYTNTGNLNITRDGTAGSPATLIGVKPGTTAEPPTQADWAYGSDRPEFALGATYISFDNHIGLKSLDFGGAGSNWTLSIDTPGFIYNCKILNTSAVADVPALRSTSDGLRVMFCDLAQTGSESGRAIYTTKQTHISDTYIHGSAKGYYTDGALSSVLDRVIFDTCGSGVVMGVAGGSLSMSNFSIYACTLGIDLSLDGLAFIINGNISHGVDGISATAEKANTVDYVNFYSNSGTDVTNVTKGPNCLALDPEFVSVGTGDFTVGNTNLIDAGIRGPNGFGYSTPGAVGAIHSSGGGSQIGAFENGAWR